MYYKLFCFAIFMWSFNQVSALKCYACMASTSSDCSEGKTTALFHQTCQPQSNPGRPLETFCVAYSQFEIGQEIAVRGCGYIFEGVDICRYLNLTVSVKSCSFCNTDLCNLDPI